MLKKGDLVRVKKNNAVGIFLRMYPEVIGELIVYYNNEEWVFFDFEIEKLGGKYV
jgi:hypothetical protein